MFKVVVNTCYGGFSLSNKALAEYNKRAGTDHTYGGRNFERDDKHLVAIVEELGDEADGSCAELTIKELPDDVANKWYVEEYDGWEHIAEEHRTW